MSNPERIGKFEIRKKLGEGATSEVYLGYDPFAARDVAIKLIFPEALKDKDKGQMYQHMLVTEASLAGKLSHPHIVQIFDAVVSPEQSYIVMEYVPGGTLEAFCKPSTLIPVSKLVEIIFKCTRALEYAQRLGIIHRDIKPANILLAGASGDQAANSGDIKISDFGAAMMSDTDQTRTQVAGVGSPAYMSPQQVQEQVLTHQTDIYSLGVVMYQLLSGRLPYQATSNYGMVYQICNGEAPPPSTFRVDIPAGLDAIVARAMQKNLATRYQTWGEFAQDLAQSFRNKQQALRTNDFPDSEKFENLRALAFFSEFSDVEIWEVVRFSRWTLVTPDTIVMKDGEAGDSFAFLLEGELRVSKRGRTLDVLEAGECFGEMAVARRDHNRGADVIANSAAKVVTVSGEALRHASDTCRMNFYQAFMIVVAGRLDSANARLAGI